MQIPNYIFRQIEFVLCPICNSAMRFVGKSAQCDNKHSYDLAKSMYINLLGKQSKSVYNKELFTARLLAVESGFFDELIRAISEQIIKQSKNKSVITLLDAGCGDGGIFDRICKIIEARGINVNAIAIDICRDAVMVASKKHKSALFIVADIANLPIRDHSIDFVLNILSPANYAEFDRILNPDGIVIKAIPDGSYLQQIREIINKNDYENKDVIELFANRYNTYRQIEVKSVFAESIEKMKNIIEMTPLTLHQADKEHLASRVKSISADFVLLLSDR